MTLLNSEAGRGGSHGALEGSGLSGLRLAPALGSRTPLHFLDRSIQQGA